MKKIIFFAILIILSGCSGKLSGSKDNASGENEQTVDKKFERSRENMVEFQLANRDISDTKVIAAMLKTKRHLFIPEENRNSAYKDSPVPIGSGQTISQPYIVAIMTQLLGLKGDEKVLEIGTGSGYQSAVLSDIVKDVYTIEIIPELGNRAMKLLKRLGYKNVHVRVGDGYRGWPEAGKFDAVIITAAPPRIPQPLLDQLKVGGRMVLPLGKFYQELVLVTKTKNGITKKNIFPVQFVPMTGEIQTKW